MVSRIGVRVGIISISGPVSCLLLIQRVFVHHGDRIRETDLTIRLAAVSAGLDFRDAQEAGFVASGNCIDGVLEYLALSQRFPVMTETSQLYVFDDKSATSTSAPPRKQP